MHIVKKRLKNTTRWYVYAWRGGPMIHKQDGDRPQINQRLIQKQQDARAGNLAIDDSQILVDTVIRMYENSGDFQSLAPNTRKGYQRSLTEISRKFGKAPLVLFSSPKAKSKILDWRDELRHEPAKTDLVIGQLRRLLDFAVDRNLLPKNPATGIGNIHKTNRADLIWEPRHWQALDEAGAPQHLKDFLFLASCTGLRGSDVVCVNWAWFKESYIEVPETMKTGTSAIIPMVPELAAWVSRQKNQEGLVIRTSKGQPWSLEGVKSSFARFTPPGFDRHIHDLRGTFATRLIVAGFTDSQVAMVLGWSSQRVEAIRSRYVDRNEVMKQLSEKLADQKSLQIGVN